MASDSSAGFHHQQQGILFKSGGVTSSSSSASGGGEFVSAGHYNGGGSLNLCGNDGPRGGGMLFSPQNSLDSCLTRVLDSVPGLKHNTGFSAEWSMEEQYKLEEGLAKYADEPNIVRYIKIAASLRDKTVRDVALRCRWMMRKRRKHEDQSLEKKVKDQKHNIPSKFSQVHVTCNFGGEDQILEKFAESAMKNNISSASSINMATYSSTTNPDQSDCKLSGVLSGTARHLLEENNQAFEQISVNLSTLKPQQNIDLFFRTRNNLVAILNVMSNMPGIMSQMPPLPVHFNEELASSIFLPTSQGMMFRSTSTTLVKQEPGC